MHDYKIPSRTNKVLNVILLGMILILVRVWYLGVVQHDAYLQQARKPQRRTVIEHVERATIRDRFNLPLAVNKIQFNAAICYAHIREIPSITWKKDENGKRVRVLSRMLYISELAHVLGQELNMDPQLIEDTIHGKASLFPHTPFVLKADISEEEYYRLKILEKEWLGIQAERSSKRSYPQGKIGCDIVGYLGAINSKEYRLIAQEIQDLQTYLSAREMGESPFLPKGFNNPLEVRDRLRELQEKAYTINDQIGKAGIEASFDPQLRGFYGKKAYEIDVKGNFLRELPGSKKAIGGQRLLLTISAELQEYAEALLAQHETHASGAISKHWMKGGAIVAMQAQTGEVLAMASYPRFDPNDFTSGQRLQTSNSHAPAFVRWLENEAYLREIWEGRLPLERECYSFAKGSFYEESAPLTWDNYMSAILPPGSPISESFNKIGSLENAYEFQTSMQNLLRLSGQNEMHKLINYLYQQENGHVTGRFLLSAEDKKEIRTHLEKNQELVDQIKKECDFYLLSIPHNQDKLLLLDICRLLVHEERYTQPLLKQVGHEKLSSYYALTQTATSLQAELRPHLQELFHDVDFSRWRNDHFKDFLKEKRKEEKAKRKYTRPYTEYLDLLEKKMFKEFWAKNRWHFLEVFVRGDCTHVFDLYPELKPYLSYLLDLQKKIKVPQEKLLHLRNALSSLDAETACAYLQTMRGFQDLTRPLYGYYTHLRKEKGVQLEKHLAAAFYPSTGFGYGRSQAYRQSTPQGSVFKIITAYEALQQRYHTLLENKQSLDQLNPLTLIDNTLKGEKGTQILGYSLDGKPITRNYKGGRLPKSSHPNMGKIDLLGALEQSSNVYFSILASEHMHDPQDLAHAARLFGYGEKTGIELPGEIIGSIPNDLSHNLTGLYSFAIGQHSLIATPLQAALMLSAIGNGGKLLKPHIVKVMAAKEPYRASDSIFRTAQFPYEETLSLVGVGFPLFTEMQSQSAAPRVAYAKTKVNRELFLPKPVRSLIVEGMHRAVTGLRGTARPSILRNFPDYPQARQDYVKMQGQILAKTGTAEILHKRTLDAATPARIENHVWFAAISFTPENQMRNQWENPELAVVVYLRFGRAGKEGALIATEIIKKWREICAKHGCSTQ